MYQFTNLTFLNSKDYLEINPSYACSFTKNEIGTLQNKKAPFGRQSNSREILSFAGTDKQVLSSAGIEKKHTLLVW